MIGVSRSPVAGPLFVMTAAILDKSSQVVGTSPVASMYALMIGGIDTNVALVSEHLALCWLAM